MIVGDSLSALQRRGLRDAVLACGVFDGVHLGHQRIIKRLTGLAAERNATPVVVTFDPHPRAILRPEGGPQMLTISPQKLELLGNLGAEAAAVLHFSTRMARTPPADFLNKELLCAGIRVHAICVGKDWRFGRNGEGDLDFLREAGEQHDFYVEGVEPFTWQGRPVSSTRIRRTIRSGHLHQAAEMLGRPHSVRGQVSHGKGLGTQEMHCPTANLEDPRVLLPPAGVYAACARLNPGSSPDSQNRHAGIVYVGTAPTIARRMPAENPIVELHLFEFSGDLYGETVEIEFRDFIRADRRFESYGDLRNQINRDITDAKQRLKRQH